MTATLRQFEQTESLEVTKWAFGLEVQVVDFLSGYSVTGTLEGFTPGEVTVALPEIISEQRAVTVRFHSFIFGGETLYCQAKEGRYEAHITIDDAGENGMRKAPRFPVRLSAQMFLSDGVAVPLTIIDISGDGLGIELPVRVERDQPIAITSGSVFIFAIVKHCCAVSNGLFRAGVEMQHLFERNAATPTEQPTGGLLGKVFGKRLAAKREIGW